VPNKAYDFVLPKENQRILQTLAQGPYTDRKRLDLLLWAESVSLIQGFDVLLAPQTVNFDPLPYQTETAEAVLRRLRGRAILGDEVGLGKTIEAGLILKEYMLRGMARRVLILTPPALVGQWQEELEQKFGLHFITNDAPAFRSTPERAWADNEQVIASLTMARREPHSQAIRAVPYDLVIVDEAHHLKNRASQGWRFVNDLKARHLLLLTATPVQNNLEELYNLVTLLQPGQLKTSRDFRREFIDSGDPRLPKNRLRLRDLLADVMIRNTRAGVHLNLPRRQAVTISIHPSPAEKEFYQAVSAFVRHYWPHEGAGHGSLSRMALQTLLMEAGSSPFSTIPTLLKMAEAPGLPALTQQRLRELAAAGRDIADSAKALALLKLMQSRPKRADDKVIIFTKYRETLRYLDILLRQAGYEPAVYHGELSQEEKDACIAAFEARLPILLCTEAAGEGRNLQFCHTMVNYDLPWNPMRIEQRVGRIHRIGQGHEVTIYNLSAEGTIEAQLLDLLDKKINMFEMVIGEMDMILGNLADERDFEGIVTDVWVQAESDEDVRARMDELAQALSRARDMYLQTRSYDEALFGGDFAANRL
jgi:SNF2 family DNA or RNA helicase